MKGSDSDSSVIGLCRFRMFPPDDMEIIIATAKTRSDLRPAAIAIPLPHIPASGIVGMNTDAKTT